MTDSRSAPAQTDGDIAMKRLHLGRIAGAVAAAALVLGVANIDAVSLMAAEATQPDMTLHDGQVRIDVEQFGAFSAMRLPDVGATANITRRCIFNITNGRRICGWHGADTRLSGMSIALRSRDGATQLHFDSVTTDTVTVRNAVVNQWDDKANHQFDVNLRSTQHFAGVSSASRTRVLSGADTLFRTKRWGTRFATRIDRTTIYSNVSMPNNDPSAYPTAGVIYSSSHTQYGAQKAPRDAYSSTIVYFDGSRTPLTLLDGTQYTLDLETGIATPVAAR
jgi:hypothetical protein